MNICPKGCVSFVKKMGHMSVNSLCYFYYLIYTNYLIQKEREREMDIEIDREIKLQENRTRFNTYFGSLQKHYL